MLRKLARPPGNCVYSGVQRLLTGKRLRVMQKLNESVVAGSGVFYYNILWGHVSLLHVHLVSRTIALSCGRISVWGQDSAEFAKNHQAEGTQ